MRARCPASGSQLCLWENSAGAPGKKDPEEGGLEKDVGGRIAIDARMLRCAQRKRAEEETRKREMGTRCARG